MPSIPSGYSEDTEVLTSHGWVFIKDTTDRDLFFTMDPHTNKIKLQKRQGYSEQYYEGYMLLFDSSKVNLLITPEQNTLLAYYKTRNSTHEEPMYQTIKAQDINKSRHYWFKRSGLWKGIKKEKFNLSGYIHNDGRKNVLIPEKKISMDNWLAFMGYWLSEGSLSKNKCKRGGYEYNITVSQKKHFKKMAICIKSLGFSTHCLNSGISFTNKQIYLYLKKFGKCHEKFIPNELKQLCPKQLNILFNALMLGDGSNIQGKNGSHKVTYYTTSKKLSDDMQELCLKIGLATTVYKDDRRGTKNTKGFNYNHICYQVRIKGTQSTPADKISVPYSAKKEIEYKGKIYSLKIPGYLLMIQREGKSCWGC
jgi:replicative DNA helicase Mcm